MRRFIHAAAIFLVLSLLPRLALADDDLRSKYGTRSLEAAQHLQSAMKLASAKQPDDALKEIQLAVKADSACAMAWYWQAIIKADSGDLDGAIESYKSCAALSNPSNLDITTDGKCNLGIMLGQLKRYDESIYWFSKAITEDPDDHAHEQGRVYRNLAITLHVSNQDLAATIAAITGHEIDPQHVEEGIIGDFFKTAQGQEGARILALQMELPKLEPRTETAAFNDASPAAPVTEKITQLLSDPKGQYVLALTAGDHYLVIDTHADTATVRSQKFSAGKIAAATLAGGNLYVATAAAPQSKLLQIDPLTGTTTASWNLTGGAPKSIAVMPARKLAFFPIDGNIAILSLTDGKITRTDDPGQFVAADLSETYLYTRYKDENVENGHTVIIDGSPVYIETEHFDWEQTTLFKFFVTPHKLLTAAIRLNASSNGNDVVIDPDNQFVACPGGGGWRPTEGTGGYHIAVFPTGDFTKVQNAFSIDAYPIGCAFNPITHEFAGVRGDDVKIYSLATDTPTRPSITLPGKFSGQAVWSGNGRFLVLGGGDHGISIYKETLSSAESATATTWWKPILPTASVATAGTGAAAVASAAPQAIPAFVHFALAGDRPAIQRALTQAMASKSTDQPMKWRSYAPYTNADSLAIMDDPETIKADPGVRIYITKKALVKDPQNNGLKFMMADATRAAGHTAQAKDQFLAIIHSDAGRTELTLLSLRELATISIADKQDNEACYALVHALMLDRASPETIKQLQPLLEKLKFNDEAAKLKSAAPAATGDEQTSATLPPLAQPKTGGPVLTAASLFQKSAPSVVLIHCGDAAGSAVCIAPDGILITSLHVVASHDQIEVFPFTIQNGKAQRMHSFSAEIVARSEQDDLAILRVSNPPPTMKPLLIADQSPAVGDKVFALGNPGLGHDTLDLSLSDGIVSSTDRTIDDNSYLQHTAAVNPGNSGGPLFDDTGNIVALVCLKPHLDGVSFATPAKIIRDFYAQHSTAGK